MQYPIWYRAGAFALLLGLFAPTPSAGQYGDVRLEEAFDFAAEQAGATATTVAPWRFPTKTELGDGSWEASGRGDWRSGFFPGVLWFLFEHTGDDRWRTDAERWTDNLEQQKTVTGNHDVGFQIMSSYGLGLRMTDNEAYTDVILTTANSLATRYDDTIGATRSWDWGDWNFPVIVDNMMNLELLFWAAEHGGPQELYDIAVRHAETTMEYHVRDDGSTYHVVDFNDDGTVRQFDTHQGFETESTWSRGQAWALYGFTMTYRFTEDDRFLETARSTADYFLENLPEDHVPYTDFEGPNPESMSRDASAAAIAASALLELNQYVEGDRYREAAIDILESLTTEYLAEGTDLASIVQRASEWYGGPERGLIYADYYLLEALVRLEKGLNLNHDLPETSEPTRARRPGGPRRTKRTPRAAAARISRSCISRTIRGRRSTVPAVNCQRPASSGAITTPAACTPVSASLARLSSALSMTPAATSAARKRSL